MLSWGNWRMIACATVSPPIPESKTPIGRDDDMARLPGNPERELYGPRRRPQRNFARQVPEQRGDISVRGREEMIRDQDGDPVLEVRASRLDQRRREGRALVPNLRRSRPVHERHGD